MLHTCRAEEETEVNFWMTPFSWTRLLEISGDFFGEGRNFLEDISKDFRGEPYFWREFISGDLGDSEGARRSLMSFNDPNGIL